jgi:DNA-binding MarR family transcriptional regulator
MDDQSLGRYLHLLTARIDRAAEAILRTDANVSYSRFLALLMVGSYGADTQRALSQRLGVTEPSVSRTVRVLENAGLLDVVADPAGGNRRLLRLTPAGERLVTRWGAVLERRLAAMVEATGVPYSRYLEQTKQVLVGIEAEGPRIGGRAGPREAARPDSVGSTSRARRARRER